MHQFTLDERDRFNDQGFVVVRALADAGLCRRIRQTAIEHLANHVEPVEYEADLRYPGAPSSLSAPGGRTIRRLLQAYRRHPVFREWAASPAVLGRLQELMGEPAALSQAHHNCVMTKQPTYSSRTGWHRDIRYWSFERPDLISVWLALGAETPDNGCLSFLPGSHRIDLPADRYDEALFLRDDLPENGALIGSRVTPALEAGDAVFFHCRTFHAAGPNRTELAKLSLVFTYHGYSNLARAGTRSATIPSIAAPLLGSET